MYHFAIVGCGRIAPMHAEQILRLGKLAAVCDIDEEKATAFAALYGARSYTSFDELLEKEKEVQVVSVCTPHGFHAEHTIKSLQAGKHVLCEKPFCLTAAAAWQIIETEKFSRKKLFVIESTRFNPLLLALKEKLVRGDWGAVYSFQLNCFWSRPASYYTGWKGKAFPDGGTLLNQFNHYVEALLFLFGPIREAKGFAANSAHNTVMEFEDNGTVAVQMESGTLGGINWSVNAFEQNCGLSLAIIAEKGTIILGGESLTEIAYQHAQQKINTVANPNAGLRSSPGKYAVVYDELVKGIHSHSGFSNAFEALRSIEAIEKIYKAVQPTPEV